MSFIMSMLTAVKRLGAVGGAAVATGLGAVAYAEADNSKYFDPEALERGAKALREIQNSPWAKKVRTGVCVARWLEVGWQFSGWGIHLVLGNEVDDVGDGVCAVALGGSLCGG